MTLQNTTDKNCTLEIQVPAIVIWSLYGVNKCYDELKYLLKTYVRYNTRLILRFFAARKQQIHLAGICGENYVYECLLPFFFLSFFIFYMKKEITLIKHFERLFSIPWKFLLLNICYDMAWYAGHELNIPATKIHSVFI